MSTLTDMKARIASELRRSDLTSDIANAISSSIQAYQTKHFLVNENDSIAFNTVQGQDTYTAADNADIPNILKIDYVYVIIGSAPYELVRRPIQAIKDVNLWPLFTAQPYQFCWYAQKLNVSPIPNSAYQIKIGCITKKAAPATDNEADNFWMNEGERLIRCRAKAELYAHVIKKLDQAEVYGELAAEALDQLEKQTSTLEGDGVVQPIPFW